MTERSKKTKVALTITHSVVHLLLNVVFYCLVIFIVIKSCTFAYDFSYQLFGNVPVSESAGVEREIVISQGDSTMSVASKLELNKLIVNKYSFYVRAKLTGEVIQPGIYTISSTMDYDEIFDVITALPGDSEKNS